MPAALAACCTALETRCAYPVACVGEMNQIDLPTFLPMSKPCAGTTSEIGFLAASTACCAFCTQAALAASLSAPEPEPGLEPLLPPHAATSAPSATTEAA